MAELARRRLGRTNLQVTELGYGAMELGFAHRNIADDEAAAVLNAVLDAGINIIDTSPDYGRSEDLIGQSIAQRRSEYVLASKCGCVPGAAGGSEHVHTAANIRAGVEASLQRMRTDYLDIVQFHRSITEHELNVDGALAELQRLQAEGKVRFLGMSGTLPNLWEHLSMGVFDVFQIPYSLLQPEHGEVIAAASAADIGIVIRGGVARGTPTDWHNRTYYMVSPLVMRDLWEGAQLDELLNGRSRMEFLLRHTLANADLDTTIVGTASLDHLADNVAAAKLGALPEDEATAATRRVTALLSPAK